MKKKFKVKNYNLKRGLFNEISLDGSCCSVIDKFKLNNKKIVVTDYFDKNLMKAGFIILKLKSMDKLSIGWVYKIKNTGIVCLCHEYLIKYFKRVPDTVCVFY